MKFVMLPPQTATRRDWASRLGAALPEVSVAVAEGMQQAAAAIAEHYLRFAEGSP